MASKALRVGTRIGAGVLAVAAAGAIIGATALLPAPESATAAGETAGLVVVPAAINQQRVCPGPLLRFGDLSGENATSITSLGTPTMAISAGGVQSPLADVDVSASTDGATSSLITGPPATDTDVLTAAQSQFAAEPDLRGLAVAECRESSAGSWLLAGATDTGRTTLLLLANPSAVPSNATVRLFTGEGEIDAPGLSDLIIPAASQRVLSLAGFAPGAAALAIRVDSTGGLVVPTVQSSVVRGLEPGGIEFTGETAEAAETQLIPGVRVTTAAAAAERAQIGGSADAETVVRVMVPGSEDAELTVGAASDTPGVEGVVLDAEVHAGEVVDLPLGGLGDGTYTLTVQSSVPVLAAARVATVAAPDPDAEIPDASDESFEIIGDATDVTFTPGQRIDLAWFVSAPRLPDTASFTTTGGPGPRLTVTGASGRSSTLVLSAPGRDAQTIEVPAGSTVSVDLAGLTSYSVTGAEGVVAAVSYAGEGELAATVVRAANPLASAITVYR